MRELDADVLCLQVCVLFSLENDVAGPVVFQEVDNFERFFGKLLTRAGYGWARASGAVRYTITVTVCLTPP